MRPGCGEGAGDVLVAGEHEHLPVGRLLRGELDQDAGRRTRPGVVEVDQGVVHHHRQADVVAAQVADQRQPQRQENLLSRAAAEPLRIPDLPVGVVNLEPGLVDGGGDRGIPPLGEPREPAGGLPQHRRLVVAGHGGAGLLEEHVRPMQQVSPLLLLGEPLLDTGQVHLQAFQGVVVGCGLHAGGDGLPPLRGRSEGGTVPERHVAGLGDRQGGVDEDLDEVTLGHEATRQRPFGPEGRDEGHEDNQARIRHELGHLGDAPDILHTILVGEAEVAVEAVPHIVAI